MERGGERSNPRDRTRKTTCESPWWQPVKGCPAIVPRSSLALDHPVVGYPVPAIVGGSFERRRFESRFDCVFDPRPVRIRPRAATVLRLFVNLPSSSTSSFPLFDRNDSFFVDTISRKERSKKLLLRNKKKRNTVVTEERHTRETQAPCDARSSLHRSSLNRG